MYFFTGQLELMAGFGIGDVVLKLLFYFVHERAWNMIDYGRSLGGKITSAMRSPPTVSLRSDTVSNIVQKMIGSNIGTIIVTDGDDPVGIITERDILEKVVQTSKDSNTTSASDIMSSPITVIESNKSITDALKIMRDKQIRRLAVTQEGKVMGIVTLRRLLTALV